MTAGRVDQANVPDILRNHGSRIRSLEALVPPGFVPSSARCYGAHSIAAPGGSDLYNPFPFDSGNFQTSDDTAFEFDAGNSAIHILKDGIYDVTGYIVWGTDLVPSPPPATRTYSVASTPFELEGGMSWPSSDPSEVYVNGGIPDIIGPQMAPYVRAATFRRFLTGGFSTISWVLAFSHNNGSPVDAVGVLVLVRLGPDESLMLSIP